MRILVLLVMTLSGILGMAQNADSLFVKANEMYRLEKYDEALKTYEEIEALDQESWALYYNIGNIHYKMNRVAPAIFYYEKALKLRPDQQDVRFNLEFANQMVLDNIEPLPRNLGQRFMDAFILKLTYETWAKIAVGLAFLFALLFLMYHFSYSTGKKRFYFITSIITVVLVTTSVFFAFRNQLYIKNNKEAIIFATEAEVMNAPTTTSETYFELHEGTKVTVLENLDNWKKIRIADGKIGWIDEKHLREI
ncbi:MAG: tetratricopeptide repeat protein [Lutimonas sp.]